MINDLKQKISQELDYVNCNQVASFSGYSIKQLNRIFSLHTDLNLGKYIQYRRLAQALWELHFTDISIIQIAQNNGFNTQESFTRAFKSAFHITPYKFRDTKRLHSFDVEGLLNEIIEEASHENAKNHPHKLPEPNVKLMNKPQSFWYSYCQNEKNLFPHDFYTRCQKDGLLKVIQQVSNSKHLTGAYLTHIYIGQKFSSLTLGFECENDIRGIHDEGFKKYICPASQYLLVNVPPYMNYELGSHVLAVWNVFSNFDYNAHQLKRDLDHAPIFEMDSPTNGYTLYFPVTIK